MGEGGRPKMRVLKGIPASAGIAIGKGYFLNRAFPRSVQSTIGREKVEDEVAAFIHAEFFDLHFRGFFIRVVVGEAAKIVEPLEDRGSALHGREIERLLHPPHVGFRERRAPPRLLRHIFFRSAHSALMLASFTTSPHFFSSAFA